MTLIPSETAILRPNQSPELSSSAKSLNWQSPPSQPNLSNRTCHHHQKSLLGGLRLDSNFSHPNRSLPGWTLNRHCHHPSPILTSVFILFFFRFRSCLCFFWALGREKCFFKMIYLLRTRVRTVLRTYLLTPASSTFTYIVYYCLQGCIHGWIKSRY